MQDAGVVAAGLLAALCNSLTIDRSLAPMLRAPLFHRGRYSTAQKQYA